MDKMASEENDRPLWATMAQSWLRLAEHADRINTKLAPEDSPPEGEQQEADAPQAAS
jgi:hypothetical protein